MRDLNPVQWAVLPLRKYADFNGRAPRAEYWWYALATGSVGMGLAFLEKAIGGPTIGEYGPFSLIFALATLVPGLALAVRRLHDIGRTGWWALLNSWSYLILVLGIFGISSDGLMKSGYAALAVIWLIGLVGCGITMLVFAVTQGTDGQNQYGPDPYGPGSLEEVFA